MSQIQAVSIARYDEFNSELQRMLGVHTPAEVWHTEVNAALDGVAGRELARLVDVSSRRQIGAFFTGSDLAAKLLEGVRLSSHQDFIYDPTVGAGDLLLAAARKMECQRGIRSTLRSWGKCLAGTDLQPEFVEATKLRLALLARQRHGHSGKLPSDWRNYLPNVKCADGMSQPLLCSRASHVLMNPPFCFTQASDNCSWAGGRVSTAAVFIESVMEQLSPKTLMFAILPDVLRSGTFQKKWRERVSDLAKIELVQRYGIFDEVADVDVFLLKARRRWQMSTTQKRWPEFLIENSTVEDSFEVNVGRVVPHRDPQQGRNHPYIHARIVPTWDEMTEIPEKRQHKGLPFKPPFLALRRTSRPGHPYRAAATIIRGKQPVAVENHLIVCRPRDGLLKTCRALMKKLQTEEVNDFLDERISCRHLTVGAVASIPFNSNE